MLFADISAEGWVLIIGAAATAFGGLLVQLYRMRLDHERWMKINDKMESTEGELKTLDQLVREREAKEKARGKRYDDPQFP